MRKYALIGDKVLGARLSKSLIGDGFSVARASLVISRGLSNATLSKFYDLAFSSLPHVEMGTLSVTSKGTLVEAFVGFIDSQIDAAYNAGDSDMASQLATVLSCFLVDLLEFIFQEIDLTPHLKLHSISPELRLAMADFANRNLALDAMITALDS